MSQQLPVRQQHFYFEEKRGCSQGKSGKNGSEAERNTGVEFTVVGCREERGKQKNVNNQIRDLRTFCI